MGKSPFAIGIAIGGLPADPVTVDSDSDPDSDGD
jgi:hypothetical protein